MAKPTATPKETDRPALTASTDTTTQEAINGYLNYVERHPTYPFGIVLLDEKDHYISELVRWCTLHAPAHDLEYSYIDRGLKYSLRKLRAEQCEAARVEFLTEYVERQWDLEQEQEAAADARALLREPAAAIRGLQESAAGCRWMLGEWMRLERAWQHVGAWFGLKIVEAIALLGFEASPEALRTSETAYLTRLYALLSQPDPPADEIAALVAPGAMPASLAGVDFLNPLPSPSQCHDRIGALIDRELARLRPREERLRVENELPARAAAVERELKADPRLKALARDQRTSAKMIEQTHETMGVIQRLLAGAAERRAGAAEGDPASSTSSAA